MTTLLLGSTVHQRFSPKPHSFTYPLLMIQTPIHELDSLNRFRPFLSYNRWGLFSLHDTDYLHSSPLPISQKLDSILAQLPFAGQVNSVQLITIPRVGINPFRPVSFYICRDEADTMIGFFAEVTNTYNESHYYVMTPNGDTTPMRVSKSFHVSPFFDETGDYTFRVTDTPLNLSVHISYTDQDKPVFYANFIGHKKPLSRGSICLAWARYSGHILVIFPRILYQAAILYFFKKLPAKSKPPQTRSHQLRAMPLSIFQRYILRLLTSRLSKLPYGSLTFKLPDGSNHVIGQSSTGPHAVIEIINTAFFSTIYRTGAIGLGETYMRHYWTSPMVSDVIDFMIRNKTAIESVFSGSIWINALNRLRHRFNKNTLTQSRKNISSHYDLGNDFYQLFLDSSFMYSSGWFKTDSDSLHTAQIQKVDRLIDALCLSADDHVLEIGSGWGFVATRIASRYQCRVTTITLSEEQYRLTRQRINDMGLTHRVTVLLTDYRDMTGSYSAIISIEMIEAVGQAYLKTYFDTCASLLKPNGRFALQAITYPDADYEGYTHRTDFIRKHIFPGGHLPCLGIIDTLTAPYFDEISRFNLASSYARTLTCWHTAFTQSRNALTKMGFDDSFFYKWCYYLSYCQAAFQTDYLGCYQLIYQRRDL